MLHHFVRSGAWALVVVAMRLWPFLPGRHFDLAVPLSAMMQMFAYAGTLLVPVGAAWLVIERRRAGTPRPRRASSSAPYFLVIVPILAAACEFGIVPRSEEFSRSRAIDHSAPLIRDIERFRQVNGHYPLSLLSVWQDYASGVTGVGRYQYEPSGEAYNLSFEQLSHVLGTREFVVYNPRGEQQMTSHDSDLLRYTGADLDRRRGYYAVRDASRPGWKRFLYD